MTAETVHGSAVVVAEPRSWRLRNSGHGPKTVSFRAAPDHAVPEGRGAMLCSMWNSNVAKTARSYKYTAYVMSMLSFFFFRIAGAC